MIRKTLARATTTSRSWRRRAAATRRGSPRAAADDGVEVVAVLAGDGTLNEAADGLVGTDTALAPLPGGSTNVYARTLGVARDPVDATAQLLESLDAARRSAASALGWSNGRHFLFHAASASTPRSSRGSSATRELKRYAAHPLFVARRVRHLAPRTTTTAAPLRHRRSTRGERDRGGNFAIVSKTSPYTYLGRLAARRRAGAGLDTPLALTAFRPCTRRTLLGGAASALRLAASSSQRHRASCTATTSHELRVNGTGPFPYQVDGDYLGDVERLDVGYEPDVLTLVVAVAARPSAASATSGTFGDDASTPAAASAAHLVGVVDRPHVDVQTVARARARCRVGGGRERGRRDRGGATGARGSAATRPRREIGAEHEPAGRQLGLERAHRSIVGRSNDETITGRARGPRPARRPPRATRVRRGRSPAPTASS